MIVTNQLCHISDWEYDTFEAGVVTEIYDEYILIRKKRGGNLRLPTNNISNTQVRFLHKNGFPVLVKKGFWDYKFP